MKLAINSAKGIAVHSSSSNKQAFKRHVTLKGGADRSGIFKPLALMLMLVLTPFGWAQQEGAEEPLSQVKQDASELVNSIGYYTNTQKEEMVADVDRVIAKLDARMDTLQSRMESQWDTMSAAARSQARETMNKLRIQRIQVAEWYGSLKSSTYSAWDHTRQGFADAYGALVSEWEKAEAEFSANN